MEIELTHEQIVEYAEKAANADAIRADADLGCCMEKAVCRGHMDRADLIEVARWKWPGGRTRQLCEQNTEEEVNDVTRASFAADSERLRIGALLALRGVQWPMASVILHFGFPTRYPILDVRAMNAVGGSTYYTFETWKKYFELCRSAATTHNVTMRTLDRALWAYGREMG